MTKTRYGFRNTDARRLILASLLGLGALTFTHSETAQANTGFTGLWRDHTGRGVIKISRCGKSLCGKIIWLKKPFNKKGQPLTDKRNPKHTRRKRKICGLQIIGGVKKIGKRLYDKGWIYSPEKGKTYDVELTLVKANRLRVKGYAGIKLLSKTYIWKRVSKNSQVYSGKTCHRAKLGE